MSPGVLRACAFAKVNVGLEVLRRREDGYHELRTILQTIDFWDELRFEHSDSGIRIEVDEPGVPAGPENLVHRAATRLAQAAGHRGGCVIQLEKRVPPGRGLGGGSSDAAMALLALDRLWNLRAPFEDLHRLAAGLGMDVPFFLYGGTALAQGRGDEIESLPAELDFPIVLILPEFSISTAAVYSRLRLTKGEASHKLLHFARGLPEARIEVGELQNDLEEASGEHSGSIQEYKRLLRDRGASCSMMSGSGSSVYGIFHDEDSARDATRWLGLRGIRAVATRTLGRHEHRQRRFSTPASSAEGPHRG